MTNIQKDKFTEDLVLQLYKNTKFYSIKSDTGIELWVYNDGVYTPNGECYIKEFVRMKLKDAYTTHFANLVIEKIVADNYILADDFFNINNKGEICLLNGILNLTTRKLKPFTKDKIFFNKFKVVYDPSQKCDKIEQFIESILDCQEITREGRKCSDKLVIQELFGDILYTDYKFERCFMFLGEGRNGKSKLAELMKIFVGVENISSVHPSTLEDPNSFTISFFHGKLINLAMDINATAFKHISIIKSLSGRDPITAGRKFMSPIVFRNYAKLIFGANQLPLTFDTKDSFWERWILINFPYTFTDQETIDGCKDEKIKQTMKLKDPDIIDQIVDPKQLSGLLNWALDGLERLNEYGNYSYKYSPEEVKSLWIRKSDSFGAFILDYLETDYDCRVIKKDLRRAYAEYCKKHRLKLAGDKTIKYKLAEEGVSEDRVLFEDNLERVWEGIKFKENIGGFIEGKTSKLAKFEDKTKFLLNSLNVSEVKILEKEFI